MAKETGTKQATDNRTATAPKKAVRLGELNMPQRTDAVDYIKAEDLQLIDRFTIFSAFPGKNSRGEYVRFGVAWKEGDTVIKRVFTASANDERNALLREVRRHGAITNCRLYIVNIGGGMTYNKIQDADAIPPEGVSESSPSAGDDDIPF